MCDQKMVVLSKEELMKVYNICYRRDLPACLCGGEIYQKDVLHGGVIFCSKCAKVFYNPLPFFRVK